jgi:hypothetical protein
LETVGIYTHKAAGAADGQIVSDSFVVVEVYQPCSFEGDRFVACVSDNVEEFFVVYLLEFVGVVVVRDFGIGDDIALVEVFETGFVVRDA